jgi:prepilin-type N-terminal cleavage/methylation domain-containing protein/prepilin-type processing-associated H-X9-DG protein
MRTKGFSLIELLIVVAIIAVLLGIMLPAMSQAREQAKSTYCLNNIRQMTIAAEAYTQNFNDSYPPAYNTQFTVSQSITDDWDFSKIKDWNTGEMKITPGLLWQGQTNEKIQQCPSLLAKDEWLKDPYTGYNYNTSYIGHGAYETIPVPARVGQIENPGQCALFGDGEYSDGPNKFMRSPWPSPADPQFTNRSGGTQGYRHLHRTNVAFCDGHAESWGKRFTETYPGDIVNITANTGFLSADNSLYDLE